MSGVIGYIQLAEMLNDGGFPAGTSQLDGLATIAAESGRNPNAKHVNDDGSIDRGLWQINNVAHPDVTDATAYDPVLSTHAALSISKGGTDYGPWAGFTSGAYEKHLEAAKVALDGAAKVRKLKAQLDAANVTLAKAQTDLAAAQQAEAALQNKIDAAKAALA